MTWLHVLGLAVVSGLWLCWARQRSGRGQRKIDLELAFRRGRLEAWEEATRMLDDHRPPTLRVIRGGRR